MEEVTKKPEFEYIEDAETEICQIVRNRKGNRLLLAKYNAESGLLTFESFEIDRKYRSQICRAVMEDPMSGELTGRAVKGYAIAGRPRDRRDPKEPLPPKKNKMLGDKTPEFVRWLYRWRRQAFYARYGVFLDSNGDPVTAPCFRIEQGLLREHDGVKPMEIKGDGKDALDRTLTESEDGILAMRATCLTFTRDEQVDKPDDGSDLDDDDGVEPLPEGEDAPEPAETEAADSDDDEKPKRRRKKKDADEEPTE